MRIKHVCYNGELHPAESFSISTKNRAFRYGDGLFETMRSKGVNIPFYNYHFQRLLRGMKLYKMETSTITSELLLHSVERLIHADRMYNGNSIRISVFRKEGGKYAPDTNEVDFFIEADPVKSNAFELNDKGLFIDTFETHTKSSSPIGNFKNCSSIVLVLAGIFMKERKLDDVLILNEKNYLVEALSSNIFMLKANVLYTPSLKTGCVDGVMRRIVMEISAQHNIKVVESDNIIPEQLLEADEVFITNAFRGINWVVAFKNKRFLYKTSRFLIDEINKRAGF